MHQVRQSFSIGRWIILMGLFVGILVIGYSSIAPQPATARYTAVTAPPEIATGDCEQGQELVLVKRKGKVVGACPPSDPWPQGSAPVAGTIQVNPTGDLPADAVCEAASNNICSSPDFNCSPGKTCKDTWNASTHQCMCQCRS